jgi:glycerophosphoryl diester phosphodiesterase
MNPHPSALSITALLAVVLSAASAQTPPLTGVKQVVAHRGSSADRPECTLASVERAIEAGATAVEVDVRLTRDGALVILHDATLDRTTNGSGKVGDRTLAEVKQLDAGSWFDPKYREQKVPTLREVLELCGNRVDILLDLKETGDEFAKKVVAEVKAHGVARRIIVGVRSVEHARLFRKLLPEARQLGLVPTPDDIKPFAEAGVETIRIWPKWLAEKPDVIRRVRDVKAGLHLNGTTGKPDEVSELLKHRPDSLSSDDPGRLVQTLAELQSGQDGKKDGVK